MYRACRQIGMPYSQARAVARRSWLRLMAMHDTLMDDGSGKIGIIKGDIKTLHRLQMVSKFRKALAEKDDE